MKDGLSILEKRNYQKHHAFLIETANKHHLVLANLAAKKEAMVEANKRLRVLRDDYCQNVNEYCLLLKDEALLPVLNPDEFNYHPSQDQSEEEH